MVAVKKQKEKKEIVNCNIFMNKTCLKCRKTPNLLLMYILYFVVAASRSTKK